jgi:surface protein
MAIINGVGPVGIRVAPTVFPTQFISTWKTDNAGVTASNQIRIPTDGGLTYNCTVDWGDGTTSTYNGFGPTMTHTYGIAGTYTVKISGTFPVIKFAGGGDRLKILDITNWGNIQWKGFFMSFQDCSNLKITAQDTPDFSQVTTFYGCFTRTAMTSFSFKNTNLSSCTDFRYAFNQCPVTSVNFTGAILNTSSNVSMYMMFYQAPNITTLTGFNTLNTSKVTDMTQFAGTSKLASIDMSGMDFSSCISFSSAFSYAQLTNVNVTNMILNTTNSVSLSQMFGDNKITTLTGFKTLNTSKVTSMYGIFMSSLKMTSSLDFSGMDFSSCTNFGYMFYAGLISSVNVSNWVLNTTSNFSMMWMFYGCYSLTNLPGISTWNISKVSDMSQFVYYATLDTTEYSNALIYWSTLNLNSNINFKYGSTKYNSSASSARASIISNKTWTISDGGLAV